MTIRAALKEKVFRISTISQARLINVLYKVIKLHLQYIICDGEPCKYEVMHIHIKETSAHKASYCYMYATK